MTFSKGKVYINKHMNTEVIPLFLMEVHTCKRILNMHTERGSVLISNSNTKAFQLTTKHFHVYHNRTQTSPVKRSQNQIFVSNS